MRALTFLVTTVALIAFSSAASAKTFTLVQTGGPADLSNLSPSDTVSFDITYVQTTSLISLGFSVRTTGGVTINASTHALSQWLDYGTYAFFSPITAGYSVNPTVAGGWAWTAGAPPAFINAGLIDGAEPFNMIGSAGVLGTVTVHVADSGTLEIFENPGTDDQSALPGGVPITDHVFDTVTFTVTPEPTTAALMALGMTGLLIAGRRR